MIPIVPQADFDAFAAAARSAASHGLMQCSSGNLSCRVGDRHLLIKASRAWMSDLRPDQVALCNLCDGVSLNGRKPSVEIGFHSGILRTRPDVDVVLHFQTPFATTLACRHPESVNYFVIPEIPVYIGPIGHVPFLDPGTGPLADAVTAVMQTHNLCILQNHGMVTVGNSYDNVIQKAVFFELACQIILRAGEQVQPLPTAAVEHFLSPSSSTA